MMPYAPLVLDLFLNPTHVYRPQASMPSHEKIVKSACSAEGEEAVQFFFWLERSGSESRITHARFLAKGSVALIAAAEYACIKMEGCILSKQSLVTVDALMSALMLPTIRRHSVLLVVRAMLE